MEAMPSVEFDWPDEEAAARIEVVRCAASAAAAEIGLLKICGVEELVVEAVKFGMAEGGEEAP